MIPGWSSKTGWCPGCKASDAKVVSFASIPWLLLLPGIVLGVIAMFGGLTGLPPAITEWCGTYWWIVLVIGVLLLLAFNGAVMAAGLFRTG